MYIPILESNYGQSLLLSIIYTKTVSNKMLKIIGEKKLHKRYLYNLNLKL